MRVLIVSDTHGNSSNFYRVLENQDIVDMVIHCGDIEGQEYEFEEVVYNMFGCPFVAVAGNNDFFSNLPQEQFVQVGPLKAMVSHGHAYYVSMGNELIKQEAGARGADVVFYGHSHRPSVDQTDIVTAVNPGSLSYPRQEGRRPSYVMMNIGEEKTVSYDICYI